MTKDIEEDLLEMECMMHDGDRNGLVQGILVDQKLDFNLWVTVGRNRDKLNRVHTNEKFDHNLVVTNISKLFSW